VNDRVGIEIGLLNERFWVPIPVRVVFLVKWRFLTTTGGQGEFHQLN
jgi:hypothetical protein